MRVVHLARARSLKILGTLIAGQYYDFQTLYKVHLQVCVQHFLTFFIHRFLMSKFARVLLSPELGECKFILREKCHFSLYFYRFVCADGGRSCG